MRRKYQSILLAAFAFSFMACEPEFENPVNNASYSKGEADFTTYVAVGNSLTSGYMDGTMYRSGQQYSFPNLLAKQFAVVGGGAFTQPSYADDASDVGGLLVQGNAVGATRMIINMSSGGPENLKGTPSIEVTKLQAKAYNNMGVPGAKSFHLLTAGYGNLGNLAAGRANPYFVRHATTPNATVLGDAMSMKPTFFTNWIGSNDVLAYALSGGTGKDQIGNTNPASYGGNDITDPQVFASTYNTILNTLTSNGAKGVVATIPYVTSIPHFRVVPYNPLTAEAIGRGGNKQMSKEEAEKIGVATINQLNTSLFGPVKQILATVGQGNRIQMFSTTGANPVLIQDETLSDVSTLITNALMANNIPAQTAGAIGQVFGRARHATSGDLFVLGASSVIGSKSTAAAPFDKLGVTFPLEDKYVLIPSEQKEIKEATDKFNDIIWNAAYAKNIAVADMNAIMGYLVTGVKVEDGQTYYANYFSPATINKVMFSLDGVHPNARGYALVTNEIMKVINKHYKSNLPLLVPGNYPGVTIKSSN